MHSVHSHDLRESVPVILLCADVDLEFRPCLVAYKNEGCDDITPNRARIILIVDKHHLEGFECLQVEPRHRLRAYCPSSYWRHVSPSHIVERDRILVRVSFWLLHVVKDGIRGCWQVILNDCHNKPTSVPHRTAWVSVHMERGVRPFVTEPLTACIGKSARVAMNLG